MNHREIDAVVAGLFPVVRDFQIKSMEGTVESIKGLLESIQGLVARIGVLEQRAPMKGEPGKSVTVDDVRPMLEEIVAALPKPQDGKDADPVAIRLMVAEEVAKIPPASDGKSITVDDVRPMLEEMVAALPKPLDGRDADPSVIKLMVAEEVAKIPPASDGKSVTVDDVRPLIEELVAALPKPQDGKDADPSVIKLMVAEEVAQIPPASDGRDGKDIDPEILRRTLDGVSGVEQTIATLSGEIAKFRALPIAPSSLVINESGMLVAVYPDGETKSIGMVRGADGVDGDRGASIMDGSVDDTGHLILRMSDGRILNAGVVRGGSGMDGQDGLVGPPGRDALTIQPIPGIDESKSYAEGVYASYRGGVIRSERQTDPVENGEVVKAGWREILNGIAEEAEHSLDDGRILERITTYTSGKTFTRRIQTVTPIYRGIWKDGTYQRGDTVTRGGALWHCERETTGAPNVSPDWKLAVKKGQDGKDGKDGKGLRGEKGQDGRNSGGQT